MEGNLQSLNELQLDVFREIGNIGSSSAAIALSKIVDRKITLSLPKVEILKFNEITRVIGGEETEVLGILLPMRGDLNGHIMFIIGLQQAHDLVSLLLSRMLHMAQKPAVQKPTALGAFTEMEMSALQEISNIMISSYISAISTMTGLKVLPAVPQICMDMAAAILSIMVIEYGKVGDHVLYMASEFTQNNVKIGGDFFLVPDMQSLEKLLSALGVRSV